MAKKTVRRRRTTTAMTIRRNPSPPARRRSRVRGAVGSVGGALGGLQFGQAAIDAAKNAAGMLAGSFFAKRFSTGGGLRDSWQWQNYAMALIGGFASGIVAEMVKRGSGKQFLQGAIALCAYRAVSDTIAARVGFVGANFGAADAAALPAAYSQFQPRAFLGSDGQTYAPGDIYPALDGETYVMGQDGNWRATGDDYRDVGETVRAPSSLGESMRAPSSLGETVRVPSSLGSSN